jgi:hypothetical protein
VTADIIPLDRAAQEEAAARFERRLGELSEALKLAERIEPHLRESESRRLRDAIERHIARHDADRDCLDEPQALDIVAAAIRGESRRAHVRDLSAGWLSADEIFAPLPTIDWICEGLQIGPGRPTLLAGFGASGKTLAAQSLALSVAAGALIWGWPRLNLWKSRTVRHLDHEQGARATLRRYQRLAAGMGIDSRQVAGKLLVKIFPEVLLDGADAVSEYSRMCGEGELIILDSLKAATPNTNENESVVRRCLDNLTRVSEKTGSAFVVLHHAGKPKEGQRDARTIPRGSSGIFDAAGCVYVMSGGKGEPKLMSQTKSPAESEGAPIDDFALSIEDVEINANPKAGLRVSHQGAGPIGDTPEQKYRRNAERIMAVLRAHPNSCQDKIPELAGMKKATAIAVLKSLVSDGRVQSERDAKGVVRYQV